MLPRYSPLELRKVEAPRFSRQLALEGGKVVRGCFKPRAIVQRKDSFGYMRYDIDKYPKQTVVHLFFIYLF